MKFDLTRKIALVTGASRGIGEAIANILAQHGATVIGTGTSQEQLNIIEQNLAPIGGVAKLLDVRDGSAIESLIAKIEQEYGSITILVNNAGITRDNLLIRMKEEDWDELMDINLKSVYRMSKAVLKGMMKARTGRIISIASVIGLMGNAGQSNYAAAKAGMIGFSKSLAREVGSRNITVNTIAPGFIETDMTRQLPEDSRKALIQNTALGRLGNVNDIANACLFLASDEAGYITGQTLHVNGGMLMP